jgi:Uma2 family endonuclease
MNIRHRQPSTFSSAEFEKLVRSGGFGDARVELRRGVIVKMNAQHLAHARAKNLLAKAIDAAVAQAFPAWSVYQEVSVAFAGDFNPVPDIVVWDPTAGPTDPDRPIPAASVRIVIEVADSTLPDDVGEKLEDYAGAGVAEYWVVDVKGRQILQHVGPGGDTYAERIPVAFGAAIASKAYPGLRVDTASLL